MKNLIKLLAVVLVLSMASESFAQSFGVKGGLNLANMVVKDNDDVYSEDYKMSFGLNLGLTAEFPITDMLSFETGLMLNTKGFRIQESEDFMGETMEVKAVASIYYLDIPLTLKAGFDAGGAKVYGIVGPYVGFALSGKVKGTVTYAGEEETDSESIEFGSGDDQAARLDYGLLIGAGLEFGQISFGATYGLGMANFSNYSEGGYKESHRVISLSIGYKF